jgi:predicted CoA-binding protein
MNIDEATRDFLAQRRIAVAGVSREPGGKHGGNVVYQRLRDRGYQVFAVNPNADTVEGDPCYRSLGAIEGGVDAVVIATAPEAVESVLRDAHELGITRAWMHRSFGKGSVSDEAAAWGRSNGMTVIAGGCPLMYGPTSDFGHRAMCFVLGLMGGIPKQA